MTTTPELRGPVAVIAGGLSHERDVSLASGRNLVRELRALGIEAQAYDFDRALMHALERDKVAVALPALHGQFGEDGEIQTLLELLGLPFVGSSSNACRVAFDKGTARELLRRAGIPVPESVGLSAQTFRDVGAAALLSALRHRPLVPNLSSTTAAAVRRSRRRGGGLRKEERREQPPPPEVRQRRLRPVRQIGRAHV